MWWKPACLAQSCWLLLLCTTARAWVAPGTPRTSQKTLQSLEAALCSCMVFGRVAWHANVKPCVGNTNAVPSSPKQGASSPLLPLLPFTQALLVHPVINYVLAFVHQPSCLLVCGPANYCSLLRRRKTPFAVCPNPDWISEPGAQPVSTAALKLRSILKIIEPLAVQVKAIYLRMKKCWHGKIPML